MVRTIGFLSMFAGYIVFNSYGALGAGFDDAEVAFNSGNWKVLRSVDPMKDNVVCTGIYKENYGVQLTINTLYVSVAGGIESISIRFNDKPAKALRIPDKIEKKIRSVIISGSDFSELIGSDRLRLQASTLVKGVANEDFNLSGIRGALESIKAGCPIQANAAQMPTLDLPSASLCTDKLIQNMKAQGLEESQIAAICKDS